MSRKASWETIAEQVLAPTSIVEVRKGLGEVNEKNFRDVTRSLLSVAFASIVECRVTIARLQERCDMLETLVGMRKGDNN